MGERGRRERKGYLSNNQSIIADHQESFKEGAIGLFRVGQELRSGQTKVPNRTP